MVRPDCNPLALSVQWAIASGNTVDLPVPVGPWTATILGESALIVFFTICSSFISGRHSGGGGTPGAGVMNGCGGASAPTMVRVFDVKSSSPSPLVCRTLCRTLSEAMSYPTSPIAAQHSAQQQAPPM